MTEEQAEDVLGFYYNAEGAVRSSTALAIAIGIARETVLHGDSCISHKEFGRRTGACRRSIDTAIKALKRHDLISRVGTTDGGVAIYRANFDTERRGNDLE